MHVEAMMNEDLLSRTTLMIAPTMRPGRGMTAHDRRLYFHYLGNYKGKK